VITIVLIDDHKVVRQGIRSLLEFEPDFKVVGDAGDGTAGLKLVQNFRPDILITDLKMEGMNGLKVAAKVSDLSPDTKIIILSMYAEGYISKAIENGARGYVVKGSGIDEVVRAIRAVVAGEIYLDAALTHVK
jgi:DNA-binding NarL/FixJ family response regulator